jgi:uncharacterized protein (DUF58 family)
MSSPPLHDPTALARFGNLEVVAKLIVEGYLIGQHKSPFKGSSVEFVEHRQYYPGDEIRHIDWRAYAKTGRFYVKEYEEETNLRCQLLVDCSGSMAYHGRTISKYDYARQLSAALAYLLLAQRDACGLITFHTSVADRYEPSTQPHTLRHIAQLLANRRPGAESSLSRVFEQIHPSIKRRSLIILFSDCFDQLDPLLKALQQFRAARHEVILFQIVAPEEEEFPFTRPSQFWNIEQPSRRLLIDPHRYRERYLERYRKFCQELKSRCTAARIDFLKLSTAEPYETALGAYLAARSRE